MVSISEIMAAQDKGILQEVLEKPHCIVIVPDLKTAAFVAGGSGFQIGASSTDLIMLEGVAILSGRTDGSGGWNRSAGTDDEFAICDSGEKAWAHSILTAPLGATVPRRHSTSGIRPRNMSARVQKVSAIASMVACLCTRPYNRPCA